MPHLQNCDHLSDGWCLVCVKELWDEKDKLEQRVQKLQGTIQLAWEADKKLRDAMDEWIENFSE